MKSEDKVGSTFTFILKLEKENLNENDYIL